MAGAGGVGGGGAGVRGGWGALVGDRAPRRSRHGTFVAGLVGLDRGLRGARLRGSSAASWSLRPSSSCSATAARSFKRPSAWRTFAYAPMLTPASPRSTQRSVVRAMAARSALSPRRNRARRILSPRRVQGTGDRGQGGGGSAAHDGAYRSQQVGEMARIEVVMLGERSGRATVHRIIGVEGWPWPVDARRANTSE